MHSWVPRVARLAVVTSVIASTAAVTDVASATEPRPAVAWGTQIHVPDYQIAEPLAVDAYGGRTFSAGLAGNLSGNSFTPFVDVRDAAGHGVLTETPDVDVEDAGGQNTATAIDAGSWGFVVSGNTTGEVAPDEAKGLADGWVARYAADGTLDWITQVGTAGNDAINDVLVSGSTVIVVGASFPGDGSSTPLVDTLDLATGSAAPLIDLDVPDQTVGEISSIAAVGADFVIAGATDRDIDATGAGDDEYQWLARLDGSDLSHVEWENNALGAAMTTTSAVAFGGTRLAVDGGTVYLAGSHADSFTYTGGFVAAASAATGTVSWQHPLPGSATADAVTVHRGVVVVGGGRQSGGSGGSASYLSSVLEGWSKAGVRQWSAPFETSSAAGGQSLVTALADGSQGLTGAGVTTQNAFPDSSTPTPFAGVVFAERVHTATAKVKAAGAYGSAVKLSVHRSQTSRATVRLTNTGEAADRVRLKACVVPSSLTLEITAGSKDVTGQVRHGSYATSSLAPGKNATLTMSFTAGKRAKPRTFACTVTGTPATGGTSSSSATIKIAIKK